MQTPGPHFSMKSLKVTWEVNHGVTQKHKQLSFCLVFFNETPIRGRDGDTWRGEIGELIAWQLEQGMRVALRKEIKRDYPSKKQKELLHTLCRQSSRRFEKVAAHFYLSLTKLPLLNTNCTRIKKKNESVIINYDRHDINMV